MSKKKILVIDDELELVDMLKIRLEANNYEVVTAGDGEEGMAKAKSEKPDLIILDIMMPKKDGYTFIKEMRAEQGIKSTPVVILTAKAKMKDLFAIEGAKDYIVKPFEATELLEKIARYFKNTGSE